MKKKHLKMKISQGAKRDLLIISLANALLIVAKGSEIKEDEDIIPLDNSSYKINKRINRRLDKLQSKLAETQVQFYAESENPYEFSRWVRSNLDSKLTKVLKGLHGETNLESLANQILFTNFCDRNKPLHDSFKWLRDIKQHNQIFDLIEQTKVSRIAGNIYEDALKSIAIIKG